MYLRGLHTLNKKSDVLCTDFHNFLDIGLLHTAIVDTKYVGVTVQFCSTKAVVIFYHRYIMAIYGNVYYIKIIINYYQGLYIQFPATINIFSNFIAQLLLSC